LLRERGGGGSCWINATLQALWGPVAVKDALKDIGERMSVEERHSMESVLFQRRSLNNDLWIPGSRLSEVVQRVDPPQREELFLAATFRVACSPPLTDPLSPCTMTAHFYHGSQEDAAEFLTRFLLDSDASPTLARLVAYEMHVALDCMNCNHRHAWKVERFQDLSLPIVGAQPGGARFETVQAAFDDYMLGDTVSIGPGRMWDDPCAGCCRTDQTYRKELQIKTLPRVLLVQLKRWEYVAGPGGDLELRCLRH
jgi:uncharacterized UBP type Zn finger protein